MPAQTSTHPLEALLQECRKVIVGQPILLNRLLVAVLCRGHVLLEGLPGLAKTRTIKTLAAASHLAFRRIQFTPDLLPSDVVGTLVFDPKALTFTPKKGPVFTNLLLADEINRAPSKVQSALLEAMEERQVTLGEESFRLPDPFLVLATQNPIEQEGTFPLPEAQMDRFLFKLRIDYPSQAEEVEVLRRADGHEEAVNPVVDGDLLRKASMEAGRVQLDDAVRAYMVRLVQATRVGSGSAKGGHGKAWKGRELLRCGASPRASLALQIAAKSYAYLSTRGHVLPDDVVTLLPDVLRHRLLLTYEAEADGVTTDEVIARLLESVPRP
ncbi:MAG: MoxR family ATPase [Holophagaceae bacterium]|nr:MoxR family ATPase [Holophagaceae bacterium]